MGRNPNFSKIIKKLVSLREKIQEIEYRIKKDIVTTFSQLTKNNKSKTEISIDSLIKSHYPKAKFIGFVDGIGWYVRKGDLKRMVNAYADVFTFHKEEMQRFERLLIDTFLKK